MRTIRCILYVLLMIYWGFIAYLTHTPRLPMAMAKVNDKTAHFLAYGALGGLVYLCIWAIRPRWRITPLLVIALAMAYGALDERTQPYFGRDCDIRDWMSDLTGASIAAVSMFIIQSLVMWKWGRILLAGSREPVSTADPQA